MGTPVRPCTVLLFDCQTPIILCGGSFRAYREQDSSCVLWFLDAARLREINFQLTLFVINDGHGVFIQRLFRIGTNRHDLTAVLAGHALKFNLQIESWPGFITPVSGTMERLVMLSHVYDVSPANRRAVWYSRSSILKSTSIKRFRSGWTSGIIPTFFAITPIVPHNAMSKAFANFHAARSSTTDWYSGCR